MSFVSMLLRSATGASLSVFALFGVCVCFVAPPTDFNIGHLAVTVILTGISFGFGYACWFIDSEPTFRPSFLLGCFYVVVSGFGSLLRSFSLGFDVFLIMLALVPVLSLVIGGGAFVGVKLGRGNALTR